MDNTILILIIALIVSILFNIVWFNDTIELKIEIDEIKKENFVVFNMLIEKDKEIKELQKQNNDYAEFITKINEDKLKQGGKYN